jgi:hypothetical protein
LKSPSFWFGGFKPPLLDFPNQARAKTL